jgi:hypothetical protein
LEKLGNGPAMIGQPGSNGWGALQPATAALGQVKRQAKALMISTEIVNTAQDKHAGLQGLGLSSQSSGAAGQMGQAFPKSGIEPFDESGVDAALTLTGLDEGRDLVGTALNKASLNGQAASSALFDHLHQVQFGPGPQFGPPTLPVARQFGAKSAIKSPDITGQTIHRHQQRPTQGHRSHLSDQGFDQGFVSATTNLATQPQSGRDHHRHGHPDHPSLQLGSDFIRLHLSQIKLALPNHPFVNLPTMLTRPLPPILHCPFIKAIGRYNRLDWTAIGQQGQDQDHCRRVGFQPIEDRSFRGRKTLATHFAAIPLLFLTMHLYISFSNLASCRTIKIGAKYNLWVHRFASWLWSRNHPVCPMNPFFSKLSLLNHD